jgi:hypothetical protein
VSYIDSCRCSLIGSYVTILFSLLLIVIVDSIDQAGCVICLGKGAMAPVTSNTTRTDEFYGYQLTDSRGGKIDILQP